MNEIIQLAIEFRNVIDKAKADLLKTNGFENSHME